MRGKGRNELDHVQVEVRRHEEVDLDEPPVVAIAAAHPKQRSANMHASHEQMAIGTRFFGEANRPVR